MSLFPQELTIPMIGAPITMLILVWLIFTHAAKRLVPSLLIGAFLLCWLVVALSIPQNGFLFKLSLFPLPNIGLLFVPIIIGLTVLSKSSTFQKIVDDTYQPWLVGVQVTRAMGVVFLSLYARGLMPAEFALPAGIGDVIIGATAPFVALILFFNQSFGRKIAIVWNSVGFLVLIASIVLGFSTSPTPYQVLALDNPNNLLFDFPLALVPTFAVPLSLLLHIFSLRVLLKNPGKQIRTHKSL